MNRRIGISALGPQSVPPRHGTGDGQWLDLTPIENRPRGTGEHEMGENSNRTEFHVTLEWRRFDLAELDDLPRLEAAARDFFRAKHGIYVWQSHKIRLPVDEWTNLYVGQTMSNFRTRTSAHRRGALGRDIEGLVDDLDADNKRDLFSGFFLREPDARAQIHLFAGALSIDDCETDEVSDGIRAKVFTSVERGFIWQLKPKLNEDQTARTSIPETVQVRNLADVPRGLEGSMRFAKGPRRHTL